MTRFTAALISGGYILLLMATLGNRQDIQNVVDTMLGAQAHPLHSYALAQNPDYILIRTSWERDFGVTGYLTSPTGTWATIEHWNMLIPTGLYTLENTHSRKFGKRLPLISGVYKRSGIRIHSGNRAKDSKGCLIVSQASETSIINCIGTSRKKIFIY